MNNEKETKNFLMGFIKKRLNSIVKLLRKDTSAFRKNSYHNLRVEIKKLNACFLILNVNPRKNKLLKPIQIIFKKSGKVRAIQIAISYLKNTNSKYLDELNWHLKKQLTQAKKEFDEIKNKEINNQKIYKLIKNKLQNKSTESIKIKYFEQEKKAIVQTQQLSRMNSNKSIHELRIMIKELENYIKILPLLFTEIKPKKIAFMNDLLRKWHDDVSIEKMILKLTLYDKMNQECTVILVFKANSL
jgi:CHAD domain-containing protein